MNRSIFRIVALILLPGIAFTSLLHAAEPASSEEAGAIAGIVLSDEADGPVVSAKVSVLEADASATTDADGRFVLELPPGTYTLTISHLRYGSRTIEALVVEAGQMRESRFRLDEGEADAGEPGEPGEQGREAPDAIEEVVAVAKYVPQDFELSERNCESVLDVISAEQISISGDSNAAAALQRVTGLTVASDGFVYVRGLGDRYSSTLLNGAELPSPDPTRRVVPLDLFPTDVLGGIGIQKTYSPDMPGDFSGGVVQLNSKGVPAGFVGDVQLSLGFNGQSFGETGLSYDGSDRDYLGFDDGSRELPGAASALTNNGETSLSSLSDADRETVAESLPNNYAVNSEELPADIGLSFSIGDRADLESWTGGYNFAFLYDNQWRTRTETRRNIGLGGGGTPFVRNETLLNRTDNEISLGGILGLTAEFGDNRIESMTLLSRQATDSVIRETGRSNDDAREIQQTTLEWIETQLLVQQFVGEHFIGGLEGVKLNWHYTISSADRDVPDQRQILYARTDASDPFRLASTVSLGRRPVVRSWEYLQDDNQDLGFDLAWPVTFSDSVNGELKGGLARTDRERDYDVTGWQFNLPSPAPADLAAILDQPVEDQLVPENIGPGQWELINESQASDRYAAEHEIDAAYLMLDLWFGNSFRGAFGARFEDSLINVVTADKFNPALVREAALDTSDVLPAINGTWFLTDVDQIRFGISQTVNRPQVRELTPVLYTDPETRYVTRGNPDLQQADITNFDLRYERYWSDNEGISIALFYKDFTNPIEVSAIGGGGEGLGLRTFNNVSSATDYGLEFEIREELDELESFWQNFYVSGNVSIIESSVELSAEEAQILTSTDRELQGQSPWVTNLQLGYIDIGRQIDAALSFNMSGERIVEVGQKGVPDAYEQPVPQLDFAISKWFGPDWQMKLKIRNILDAEYEVEQAGLVQRSYTTGITVSISATYAF